MNLFQFWEFMIGVGLLGAVPAAGGLWFFERTRSRRRNRRGECATCGTSWRATSSGEAFLIHGRLVCSGCAERARRRMPWQFGILGVGAALGTGIAVSGADLAVMMLLPATSMIVMTVAAVQLMKFANRRTERRIAAGEFPDYQAIESGRPRLDPPNEASQSNLSL